MSSTVEVPIPAVHHRRPLLWVIIAVVFAFALAAGALVVRDGGTDSAVESHAASTDHVVTVQTTPTVCWSQYGSLLTVMATSMSAEAVDRITPVLSAETRAGLGAAAAVMAVTQSAAPTPDPVTLAWAIGQLTPAESAAITAELPPGMRDAVANSTLDAVLVAPPCP